jgi:hypothetical protein
MIRHILRSILNYLPNHLKAKETQITMTETDYSIHLCEINAIRQMDKFNERAMKAKTNKTRYKNFRNVDALYAEYRELIDDDPNYVTFTLNHLEDIIND